MKQSILTILIALLVFQLSAQETPVHKVSCVSEGHSCTFSILLKKPELAPQPGLTYYWFDGQKLHQNQGGFSGSLLHGTFEKKAAGGQMIEKGEFANGLKDGIWNTWDETGRLTGETKWQKGERAGKSYFFNPDTGEKTISNYRHNVQDGRYYVYRNDSLVEKGKYRNGIPVKPKTIFHFLKKKDKSQHPDERKEENPKLGTKAD